MSLSYTIFEFLMAALSLNAFFTSKFRFLGGNNLTLYLQHTEHSLFKAGYKAMLKELLEDS